MNKEIFNELLESVHEMDEIVKGKKQVSRSFEYPEPGVKTIRNTLCVHFELNL
jgi:putative transcriptional regulator